MDKLNAAPAVEYPSFSAGGKTFFLCWGPIARYQLQRYGFWDFTKPIPVMAWAAAAAGTVGSDGNWQSADFASPIELIKLGGDKGETAASEAVLAMLKNLMPAADLTLAATPATNDTAAVV